MALIRPLKFVQCLLSELYEIPSSRALRLLESFGDSEYVVGGGLLEIGDLVWSSCGGGGRGGEGGDTFDAATVFSVCKLLSKLSRLFSDPWIITVPLWYMFTVKIGLEWSASS